MKHAILLGFATVSMMWGQMAPGDNDPVVAVVEGQTFRASELERLVFSVGGAIPQRYRSNKAEWLKQYGLLKRLTALAEAEKLDQQDPTRYQLEYGRLMLLAQAKLTTQNAKMQPSLDELKAYYEAHKAEYTSAQVRAILLTYDDPKVKPPRTEAEAGKLAAQVVKEARAGANFAALVKQYSDDDESKEKGGVLAPMKSNDTTVPPQMLQAVYALKPGQISEPVKMASGYWIFQLEAYATLTQVEAAEQVHQGAQQAKFTAWVDALSKEIKVEIKDPNWAKQQ